MFSRHLAIALLVAACVGSSTIATAQEEPSFPILFTNVNVFDYVLWANDPTQKDPIAKHMHKLATRIIFDSESCSDLNHFAKTALSIPDKPVADLNWARIEGWRVLLSNLYRTPDRLNVLRKAQKIHITFNSHITPFFTHTRIQALYLQAWLASCLGWELKSLESGERTNSFPTLPARSL